MVQDYIQQSYAQILTGIQSSLSNNQEVSSEDKSDRKIEIGVALIGFNGKNEQDLNFKIGEKILIESKIKGSSWFYGSIGSRKGWFPAANIKIEEHYL